MKIRPNDPCPCGSGKKYKKCHFQRELEHPLSKGEIKGIFSKHSISKKCFYPGNDDSSCRGKIIDSHTVSKKSSLRKIAVESKVYHFKPDINLTFDNDGELVLKEIGINQASTFPGFCQHHDNSMFAPIDDTTFEANEYNSFLLGFRALTKEIYAKERAISLIEKMREFDKGKDFMTQSQINSFLNDFKMGSLFGLRDLNIHKDNYDKAYLENDFSHSNYLDINFTENPNILFSGAIYPEFDFCGNRLQTLGRGDFLDLLAINAIATSKGGSITFHWMGNSEVNEKLISSFISIEDKIKPSLITQFAFECFENLFISHKWWDNLGDLQKKLSDRVTCGTPIRNHEPRCFIPDGYNYFKWKTFNINSNIKI